MPNICWLNGAFMSEEDAKVSAFDRGFIFGDGVYEVTSMLGGTFIDSDRHLARLDRSLQEIELENPHSADQWLEIMHETAQRSGVANGFVYMQVTRGPADRDFVFPSSVRPTALVYARTRDFYNDPSAQGATMLSVPDLRWARRDIKSTSLLAQVLAKQQARAAGFTEALMHENGVITEGGSSTVWMLAGGRLHTRPLSHAILAGITRLAVFELAARLGIEIVERTFTVDEACAAEEVMISSATGFITPIIRIDDRKIGSGNAGATARRLRAAYIERAQANSRDAT